MAVTQRIKPYRAARQRIETIAVAYGDDVRSALAGVVKLARDVEEKITSPDLVERAAALDSVRMAKSLLSYIGEQYLKASPEVERYLQLRETIDQKTRSLEHYRAKWASRAEGDPEKKKFAAKVRAKATELTTLVAQKEAVEAGRKSA